MAYSVPAAYIAQGTISNAAVNVDTVVTYIGAPGVGFAIRLVFASLSIRTDSTALVWVRNLGGPFTLEVAPGAPFASINIPEPGYQLGENLSLQGTNRANVASQSLTVTIGYFIDVLN